MKRWLLIVIALLVCIELVLRFGIGFGEPPLVVLDDPEGIEYRLKPSASYQRWGNHIAINRHGLRGGEFDMRPKDGVRRAVLIGDSVVYGNHFLDQSEIMGLQLEAMCGPNLEAATIAASSWGPVNQAAFIDRYGLFGADIGVIVLSSHDLWDVPMKGVGVMPYRLTAPLGATGDFMVALWEHGKRKFFPSAIKAVDPELARQRSLAALETMLSRMQTEKMSAHIYLHPITGSDPNESTAWQNFSDIAGRYGAEIHNLENLLKESDYRDRIHPTASGAALYSNAIARAIGCL